MEFLRILAGIRNDFLTLLFSGFTELAGETVLLVMLCLFYWCIYKKLAYRLGFAYMASSLTINNLKVIFRIDRPWILDPAFKPVESAVPAATGYSFPSGHTCAATSMYGTIAFSVRKKWVKVLMFVIIAGVLFSRMYLGVHTPLDVSVSFGVTLLITIGCYLIGSHVDDTKRNKQIITLAMIVYAIGSFVLSFALYKLDIISLANASDSAKTAGAAIGFVIGWYVETTYINFDPRAVKWPLQILKVVIGAGVVLALKVGLKTAFVAISATPEGLELLPLAALRYLIMVLWAMCLYPIVIKKYFSGEKKENKTNE